MSRMWMWMLAVLALMSGALAQACEETANLPQCAQTCLSSDATVGDCNNVQGALCLSDYDSTTACYEKNCDLADYLYAMATTNALCEIPPRRRQSTQLAVGSTFIILTTIAIGLRLVGRPPMSPSFGIDDVIGLTTYTTAMVTTIVMLRGAQIGWGTDMWALDTEAVVEQMKLFYLGMVFFYFTVAVAKLSIVFFYLRIFTTQTFTRIAYGVLGLCAAYACVAVFQSIFDCTPASYFWTRFDGVSQGTCMSYAAFRAMPPINIALDVVVMVLPLPLLVKLNLPLAKKIRAISMFSVGILIIIAGILRMTHLYHSITTYNITYNGAELSYFGVIEADVSVICTCMPAIAALLKRILPRWFGSTVKTTYRSINTANSQRGTMTIGSSGGSRKHVSRNEDIQLEELLSDDSHIQRPQRCLTPVR